VHGFIERIAGAVRTRGWRELRVGARLAIAAALLMSAVFIADRIGLVALIASGYRALAIAILVLFIAPLASIGVWRLRATLHAAQQN